MGRYFVDLKRPGQDEQACAEDEQMDSDDDDESDDEAEEVVEDGFSPSSPYATYPNTLPTSPGGRTNWTVQQPMRWEPNHPSAASNARHEARIGDLYQPPSPRVQYITSYPTDTGSTAPSSKVKPRSKRVDSARLLISNNDQTVKLFSLDASPPQSDLPPRSPTQDSRVPHSPGAESSNRPLDVTEDIWEATANSDIGELERVLNRARARIQAQHQSFDRAWGSFSRIPEDEPYPQGERPAHSLRRVHHPPVKALLRMGGTKFTVPINHCECPAGPLTLFGAAC